MFDKKAFTEYVNNLSWYNKDRFTERLKDVEDFHAYLVQRGVDDAKDITQDDVSVYAVKIRESNEDMFSTLLIISIYGNFLRYENLCSDAFLYLMPQML